MFLLAMWSSVFGVLACIRERDFLCVLGLSLALCLCVCATERGIWWIMEQMWSVLGFSPSLGLVLTLSSSLSLAAASLTLYSSTFTSVRHFSFSVHCCFPFHLISLCYLALPFMFLLFSLPSFSAGWCYRLNVPLLLGLWSRDAK